MLIFKKGLLLRPFLMRIFSAVMV